MGRLDGITLKELHEIREQTEGGKPRERVLAAIGRKQGDRPSAQSVVGLLVLCSLRTSNTHFG